MVDDLLAAAAAGRAGLLVVEGPAGIGKTRLLATARRRAADAGLAVLGARSSELEHEFSYGVVRQLFEPAVLAAGGGAQDELLAGAAALAAPLFDPTAPDRAAAAEATFAVLHGLFWLTANLAERGPLLLVVDDLHCCDPPSLRFVTYLARRLEGLPALLAVGLRPEEPGADHDVLAELTADPLATVLHPAALSEDAVVDLVQTRLAAEAAPAFTAAVHEATGGNPLLLHELLTAVELEAIEPSAREAPRVRALGPDTIAARVLRRIAALGEDAIALARSVAILGDAGRMQDAAALASLSLDDAAAAAAELRRVGILQRRGAPAFVHPVVRSAVAASLDEAERERGHARAAVLLTEAGATPEQIAVHLLHTPPATTPQAIEVLRQAAQRALARGAADSAAGYLARALREPADPGEEADLLFELGLAEARRDAPAAAEHMRAAYARSLEPRRLAETAIELSHILYGIEQLHDAVGILDSAIDQLAQAGEDELVQRLEAEAIALSRFDPELYPRSTVRLRRIEDGFDVEAAGGRQLLAILASECSRRGNSAENAARLAERALAGGVLIGEHTFTLAAQALVHADRVLAGRAVFDEAINNARSSGAVFVYVLASALRSNASFRLGELAEAEADARSARAAAESASIEGPARLAAAYLSDVLVERGDVEEAARVIDRAGLSGELPATYQMAWVLESRGRLRTAQGRFREGFADCMAAGERMLALDAPNPGPLPWRSSAALALLGADDLTEARVLAIAELELARAWGAPRALGRALRVAGAVTGGDEGLALQREAVDVLAGSTAQLEHAYALTELGAALRRQNQRSQARPVLAAGLDPRAPLRRGAPGGAGPHRAPGDRRPPAPGGAPRRRRPDAERGPRRPDGRRRPDQPRDRPGAVRHRRHSRDAPVQRLSQARHHRAVAVGAARWGRSSALRLRRCTASTSTCPARCHEPRALRLERRTPPRSRARPGGRWLPSPRCGSLRRAVPPTPRGRHHEDSRARSPSRTRGHSSSSTEYHAVSRTPIPGTRRCLRWMPSNVAPIRSIAPRERSLPAWVLSSTRMQPSVSNA